jgi:hypothetical protein
MYKFARILLVFSICLSIFVSTISVSALNVGRWGSSDSKPFNSVTVTYAFPMPTVNDSLNYASVAMKDLSNYGAPGEPVLPYKTARILIPQGKELDNIQVIAGNRIKLEGKFNVEYGTTPIPVSSNIVVADKPNPSIYSSSTPFPGTLYSQVAEQYLRGYKIALLTLNPVQYIPKTGELVYYKTITVTLSFKETGEISSMFRNLPQDETRVLNVVDNPEVIETYTRTDSSLRPTSVNASESYNYVIITNSALNASFQPLIDSKIDKGLNATTVLVQDILNDPDYFCNGPFGDGCGSTAFNDTAARIRNFIKDAYENWGTEYVLLGGDIEIIPARGVYGFVDVENPPSPYTVDRNMPCDLYYGALDGSWNNDNDTVFGEECFIGSTNSPENGTAGDEADYFAEVYIGRAPVNTAQQVSNFVDKILWYEQTSDEDYLKKALLVAEKLDDQTQAANSVDLTTEYFPQYTMTRLFERDGTYSKNAVISNINSGTHILLHDGHTNSGIIMDLGGSDIDALKNTEYFLGYSLGCYAAAFEVSDSVIEHFVYSPNGSFAFIGNSRYGWYNIGSLNGAGDQFERTFFDALNNTARNLGKALALSKESFADSTSAIRWTYFELNLFGDPETEIVTDLVTPTAHINTHASSSRLTPAVLKGDAILEGIAKRGAAAGATFDNYTIQYGTGTAPTTWKTLGITLVNDGQNEIVDGVLGTWNTRLVTPNTLYTIKLTAYDESGRTGEDRWLVKVKAQTTVQVNPQLTETLVPQNFTVTVKINNVEELWELEIHLNWNTTLVDYVGHTVYALLKTPATTEETLNLTTGTYRIWSKSQNPATPYSGSGNLFSMTFHAKAPGTCLLNISQSTLKNHAGQSIIHDTLNGTAEIDPGIHDVAITDLSASKTVAPQGLIVEVYVTVENQGSYAENFNVTAYTNETSLGTTEVSLASYSQTIVTFNWNTSGLTLGNYTLSANATVVDGEDDTEDNVYTDGIITVMEASFDVAVVNISVSKMIVGDECAVLINVTVENQADLACTFNVTAYADLNLATIGDEIIIGIQNVTLTGGNVTTITFTWDTHGVAHGNYTVSAYATPLEAESDLEDNMCTGCGVVVSIIGDMDGDFDVDLYDAVGLLARYGAKKGNPQYDLLYDIDGDGDIDLYDAVALLAHYGQKDI